MKKIDLKNNNSVNKELTFIDKLPPKKITNSIVFANAGKGKNFYFNKDK